MSLLRIVSVSACALVSVFGVSTPASAKTLQEYGQQSSDLSARRGPSTAPGCLPAEIKAALARVRADCGRVQVVSTPRPGARIAGSGRRSYHASCRAVDFNAPKGCALGVLSGWQGGLGVYSGAMNHLHIDNGPRVRFAHGGGRRAAKTRTARRGGGRYAARSMRSDAASSARRLRGVRHVSAKARSAKRLKWRARPNRRR
jgi:hypothetical protein